MTNIYRSVTTEDFARLHMEAWLKQSPYTVLHMWEGMDDQAAKAVRGELTEGELMRLNSEGHLSHIVDQYQRYLSGDTEAIDSERVETLANLGRRILGKCK